ncbi:hypothetical protein [Streptomyces sp. NPDC001221]
MTDRLTASTINDEQLDALYEQRDRLGYEVQQWKATYGEHALRDTLARLHDAETTVARLRQLRDAWLRMTLEPGQVRRLLDEITAVLGQPAPAATATQATGADTCGHVIDGGFGRPLGPCLRPVGHREVFHRDANGTEWRPTRSAPTGGELRPA